MTKIETVPQKTLRAMGLQKLLALGALVILYAFFSGNIFRKLRNPFVLNYCIPLLLQRIIPL